MGWTTRIGAWFSGGKRTVRSIVEKDTWSLAEGERDRRPFRLRFREGFETPPDLSAFPKLLRVTWTFRGDGSGFPDAADNEAMEVFENRLVPALEHDFAGVLTAVITHDRRRTWAFYVTTVQAFSERLHEMPQEEEPYPIHIEAKDDPAWEFLYEDILAGAH